MNDPRFNVRLSLIAGFAVAGFVAALSLDPVPQDQAYHQFADQRPFLGIPHFGNVVSNLPFVLVGAWGLFHVLDRRRAAFRERWERGAWSVLFASVFAVGFGSAYYHARPCDETLFWDRLPMTTLFSSFLAIAVGERTRGAWGARLLVPLLVAGAGSLLCWQRAGDLRFYGLLQGLAMAAIPVLLLLFPPAYTRSRDWWAMVLLYAAAKVFEVADGPVDRLLGGAVSGHTIKHLLAAAAAWRGVVMIRQREPQPTPVAAAIPAAEPAA
jgi:hypothetical protein